MSERDTWRATFNALHDELARVTKERDEARAERDEERYWKKDARAAAERYEAERDATHATIAALRSGLERVECLLGAHERAWEHEGDEESGACDEDCRACEYTQLLERCRALLAAPNPGDGWVSPEEHARKVEAASCGAVLDSEMIAQNAALTAEVERLKAELGKKP